MTFSLSLQFTSDSENIVYIITITLREEFSTALGNVCSVSTDIKCVNNCQ